MLNLSLADRFARSGPFLWPDYRRYGLAQVPAAVTSLLGAAAERPALLDLCPPGSPRRVVLLVLDGFGFDQWVKYAERHPFLRRMTERGMVSPITTVFPSTTAAAITTLHSGRTPLEHALPEWWVWFDEAQDLLETLLFRPLKGTAHDLLARGVQPTILFSGPTLYESLRARGVACYQVLPEAYAFTDYTRLVCRGGATVSCHGLTDLIVQLRGVLDRASTPCYVYAHWGGIDRAAHMYGPDSPPHLAAIAAMAEMLERELAQKLDSGWADDTLLLVTADHGLVRVDPSRTLYLDRIPEVTRRLAVPPWGSPRDVFLRVSAELPALKSALEGLLAGEAVVMETEEALRRELFGPGEPTELFRRRVGDLIVLPYGSRPVWYELRPGLRYDMPGMHGNLTPDEMLIPFAAARLSELRA